MSVPNLAIDIERESDNKPAVSKTKKWVPKKWEAQFDEWVVRSVMGESNLSIAKRANYTPQHICNILNTPQAKLLRRQLLDNLQKNLELRTEERLAHIQDRALTRITQVLDNDKMLEAAPLALVDRCIALLRGTGLLKPETASGVNAKNAIFLGGEQTTQLLAGLKAADEAKQLHSGTAKTPVMVDVTPTK